jgi:hypothetical protein
MAKRKKAPIRHRFPDPAEMAVLDGLLSITPEAQRAAGDPVWRKMRQMCCRMKYEERTGDWHPAWEGTGEVDPMTHNEFVKLVQPPPGMLWIEFGRKWDIGPAANSDGSYDVVLRHADIEAQWHGRLLNSATPLG